MNFILIFTLLASSTFTQAEELINKFNFTKAKNIIAKLPAKDPRTLVLKAYLNYKLNYIKKAAKIIRQVPNSSCNTYLCIMLKGILLNDSHFIMKALKQKPTPQLLTYYAKLLVKRGNLPHLIWLYNNYKDIYPEIGLYLVHMLLVNKQYKEALRRVNDVLALLDGNSLIAIAFKYVIYLKLSPSSRETSLLGEYVSLNKEYICRKLKLDFPRSGSILKILSCKF